MAISGEKKNPPNPETRRVIMGPQDPLRAQLSSGDQFSEGLQSSCSDLAVGLLKIAETVCSSIEVLVFISLAPSVVAA